MGGKVINVDFRAGTSATLRSLSNVQHYDVWGRTQATLRAQIETVPQVIHVEGCENVEVENDREEIEPSSLIEILSQQTI